MHVALNMAFLTPGEMGGLEIYARRLTEALARRGDLGSRCCFLVGSGKPGRSWGA